MHPSICPRLCAILLKMLSNITASRFLKAIRMRTEKSVPRKLRVPAVNPLVANTNITFTAAMIAPYFIPMYFIQYMRMMFERPSLTPGGSPGTATSIRFSSQVSASESAIMTPVNATSLLLSDTVFICLSSVFNVNIYVIIATLIFFTGVIALVFSSLIVLFRFLPVFLILYYIIPNRFRNLVLLIGSLFFYSWGEVRYFPIMVALISVNYFAAYFIDRTERKGVRKALMLTAVIVSFSFLLLFKYTDFFIENINSLFTLSIPFLHLTLPLGISFYTFQTVAYTIDVYRGSIKAEKDFVSLAAFISMFPQLIAGPIVRYQDVQTDLHRNRKFDIDAFELGIERFVFGMSKKVLIANSIGKLWDEVQELGFPNISQGLAWLGLIAFTLQIFFDFSGYSDMAIGLGYMMGFHFPENFDAPYTSRSITEFWRRWHMTLGSWFKEYVYFPMGGSRKGMLRTEINMFVVWALTGIWHGASWNFLLWGLYFYVLLTIEKFGFKKKILDRFSVVSHIYAVFFIVLGWSLFAITDLNQLVIFIKTLFSFSSGSGLISGLYYLRNYASIFIIGIIFSCRFPSALWKKARNNTVVKTAVVFLLLVICIAYLVDSTYNPFLYFRF